MPPDRKQDENALRQAGNQGPGAQPGLRRGIEADEAMKEAEPGSPEPGSAVPGFVDHADPVEQAIEGAGVAEARNAAEDLPRQG